MNEDILRLMGEEEKIKFKGLKGARLLSWVITSLTAIKLPMMIMMMMMMFNGRRE